MINWFKDLSYLDEHTKEEEIANSAIHGVGAVLAIWGVAILLPLAVATGDAVRIFSFSIYGATLIFMYVVSAFFHGFRNPRLKRLFRIFDHQAIYLLIAGSYTPFMLVSLNTTLSITLLIFIWCVTVVGLILLAQNLDRWKLISLASYLGMSWLITITFPALVAVISLTGVVWLGIGGVFYTSGVAFYVRTRMKYNHAIWHVFSLAASTCHFFVMLYYVLPE